jgi:peptidoglycan hydrolase-like protein with peptidoglycan-binding domain
MTLTLKRGQQGDAVKALQAKLIEAKVLDLQAPDGSPNDDGVFGRVTEQAVITFQEKLKLDPDGVVGRDTRAALGLPAVNAPQAAAPATRLFTGTQRVRLAEKLDGFVNTGPLDLIDGPFFMWVVERIEAVLVAALPQSVVDMMNDLHKGIKDTTEIKKRLTQSLNQRVNIPLISEETEEKFFGFLIGVLIDALDVGRRLESRLGA